jgi:hypothetical protein
MDIETFKNKYASFKDAEKIRITCDHPQHEPAGETIVIGKQPAKRNILKNDGKFFICRQCFMKYNNPINRIGESRQTEEIIMVYCPHPEHEGDHAREMKKRNYYGSLHEPFLQICGSCVQRGKTISDEQREKIRLALKDVPKSEEFKEKLERYWKKHPERRAEATAILLANKCTTGMLGKHHSDETKEKMSEIMSGRTYTDEHCENISEGRKKMLAEQGGFTKEHREAISRATIRQYQTGFDPKLHHLKGWHESPKVGKIFYRSSYEKKAYLKLDGDESVKNYKAEALAVEYFNPEKQIVSTYLVDLLIEYVDGSQKYVEIKPEKWLTDDVVVAKIDAAMMKTHDLGWPFEVWTEMHLFGHVYNEKNMRAFAEKVKCGEV